MKYSTVQFNHDHPFKMGIRSIIAQHFHPSIAKNFDLIFETEKYVADPTRTKNVVNQLNDNVFVCEVYYSESGIAKYICDLISTWSKKQVEYALLKMVTDKLKTGVIGKNWSEKDGVVSEDVSSGKFETSNTEITKYMAHSAKKGKK